MAFVKILIIIFVLLLLFFPLLPLPLKMRRFSTFRALRYDPPYNRRNLTFVLLAIVEFVVLAIAYLAIFRLAKGIMEIPFVDSLLNKASEATKYTLTIFGVIVLNIITLYALVALKALVKTLIHLFASGKKPKKQKKAKKKKGKKAEESAKDEKVTKKEKKRGRIARILRSKRKGEEEENGEDEGAEKNPEQEDVAVPVTAKNEKFQKKHPILFRFYQRFWGLFFEKPDFVHARRYVFTAVTAIQFFIYLVEILYAVVFLGMLLAVFFPVPSFIYAALGFLTTKIYIYPFISILFLQELCNTFRSACKEPENTKRAIAREERKKEEKKKIALNRLRSKILRRYAKNHRIRYFPAVETKELSEYNATNDLYRDALNYISVYMKTNYKRVIQNYMSGLDAVFNGRHVYFGSSFYSQLGEYIITYTYVRLLAGERMLFIVSDRSQVVKLQQYIGNRLTDITGVTRDETWRVYSADSHHVNEADVLVGVPEDFATDNLVENYPAFFEEVSNAVFVDADSILNLNSYLCTIMASRLLEATERKIRFMFLSRDVLQGFSASLRKFFCIDEEVVDCNSAEENENVSYMLWNRERGALYNKHGQSETTIECLVAEAAYDASVDGIRILTSVPLKPAEKQNFMAHDVEINEFHKRVPDVNYMICTDDRCNLAAAIYAYTRFHGREASILHILSRPYLLREYFGDRVEMYANRSDLIKPRATEHADTKKLLLLRLLCEATASHNGIPISRFTERIDAAIKEKKLAPAYDLSARVAFLLSELMNDPGMIHEKEVEKSDGTRPVYTMAKKLVYSYYSIIQPERKDGYELKSENCISFLRIEEVFEKLLTNNTRVELYLNGNLLGKLDTFPERVYQQYLPGQSLIFDNCEYEIESIAAGGTAIYLRQENITYNSCVDTALLRRYSVKDMKALDGVVPGVYHFTAGSLDKICVEHRRAHIYGETYGFYNLMANSQTLDFVEGVVGNSALDERIVKRQARDLRDGILLSVRLSARGITCTDGVRKLLSAVLSEFIRTMFPDAYRCIAVCPVLKDPTDATGIDGNFNKQVETLYPYLVGEGLPTAEDDSVELLIINDAAEDIGVLDMLYDGAARIMEEVFSYIVDYLGWLKQNEKLPKGQSHYIYFGSKQLPEVYDLDGCLELLANCVRRFDESEKEKAVTAKEEYCSFCRSKLETGRYSAFDSSRLICFDCEVTMLSEEEELFALYDKVAAYWQSEFPEIALPEGVTVAFEDARDLDEKEAKDNHYYRVDGGSRRILVEIDTPENNVFVSILRGLIYFWQKDNNLIIAESEAQMTYEERRYLRSKEASEAASYAVKLLDPSSREFLKNIKSFVEEEKGRTSFDYMKKVLEEIEEEENVDVPVLVPEDDDGSESLFDPDLVPRFWKRYLRGKHATDDDGEKESMVLDSAPPRIMMNRLYNAPPVDDDDDLNKDIDAADELDAIEEEEVAEEAAPVEDTDSGEDEGSGEASAENGEDKKPSAKEKREAKRRVSLGHIKTGAELVPFEEEEKTNKLLRLYNEIARRIADYSREPVSLAGISDEELERVYYFVLHDYPEFFWVKGYSWSRGKSMQLSYRCTLPGSEEVDVKKVTKYRKELRKSVKYFTKGITRGTKPYDAMMTIYRRLVLNLDYDNAGLESGAGRDTREDDVLRSLYSALVKRKVVCVGYAVAMQYLLQSVGICCGCITSDTHEWNVVKFGRHCYHLDVTWADSSKTKEEGKNKNKIFYSYCCITSEANNRGGKERIPEAKIFGGVEDFAAIKHDYFRMSDAFLTSYDEDKLAKIFADAASKPTFEGAARCAAFRMRDEKTLKLVLSSIQNGGYWAIVEKAKALVGKNKKAVKLLEKPWPYYTDEKMYTIHFFAD